MKTQSEPMNECIDVCNSLLRGELSAVETYSHVIHQYKNEPQISLLRDMRSEHLKNVELLRQNVLSMGGDPDTDSGAWGVFAKTVQSTANLIGENSALQILQQGEDHGINEYEAALKNEDVMPACKSLIRETLLPRTRPHVSILKTLAARIS
ncbi:MAG: DUF2383 domain-containing protein [Verrucomicrobiota bacterium]